MVVVALPALALIVVALLALLLLYSADKLGKFISSLMPDISFGWVGSLRGWVDGAISSAYNTVAGWVSASVGPIEKFFLIPYHIMSELYLKVIHTYESVYNNLVLAYRYAEHIYNLAAQFALNYVHQAIAYTQHVYNLAVGEAESLATRAEHSAEGYALHLYDAAKADILDVAHEAEALYAQAVQTAQSLAVQAESLAQSLAAGVASTALAEVQAVQHLAQSLYADALDYADKLGAGVLSDAEHYAAGAIGAAVTDIDHAVTGAVQGIWDGISTGVSDLEGALGVDLPDVGALVRAIPRAVPADIAAAIAGAYAMSAVAVRFMAECGVPNCKNLSKIGRELQALFSLVEGASFLAFIVGMVKDPQTTAQETVSLLSVIVKDELAAFRNLVGI